MEGGPPLHATQVLQQVVAVYSGGTPQGIQPYKKGTLCFLGGAGGVYRNIQGYVEICGWYFEVCSGYFGFFEGLRFLWAFLGTAR